MAHLAPHLRMPSVREDIIRRLLFVTPGILYIGMAAMLLAGNRQPPFWALCAVVAFGLVAVPLMMPLAWRRLRGLTLLPEVRRVTTESLALFQRGEIEQARGKLEALAIQLVDKLSPHRVVVLQQLAYADIHLGQLERGIAILDQLEQGGWLNALTLRRNREGLLAGQIIARVQCGDVANAQRLSASFRATDMSFDAQAARALVAARTDPNRGNELITALLASETPADRAGVVRLMRLALVMNLPSDDARLGPCRQALLSSGKAPFLALKSGWAELFRTADAEGIVSS